jgi:uncharacterized membrane protein
MVHHFHRHFWFYLAALLGAVLWTVLGRLEASLRLALAGDVFYAVYLASAAWRVSKSSTALIRGRAAVADEGMLVIVLVTVGAIILSLLAIFGLVNAPGNPHMGLFLLSLAGVPLGWFTLHTIMAWHYAHLYYAPADEGGTGRDAGGLQFPGTPEPTIWDFLYYSFVVGMTAQVSDVGVSDGELRKVTLCHGIVSFFFNAVIVALSVNVAIAH